MNSVKSFLKGFVSVALGAVLTLVYGVGFVMYVVGEWLMDIGKYRDPAQ